MNPTDLGWTKISYNQVNNCNVLKKMLKKELQEYLEVFDCSSRLPFEFVNAALNMKEYKWHEENEWRLVYNILDREVNDFDVYLIPDFEQQKASHNIRYNMVF